MTNMRYEYHKYHEYHVYLVYLVYLVYQEDQDQISGATYISDVVFFGKPRELWIFFPSLKQLRVCFFPAPTTFINDINTIKSVIKRQHEKVCDLFISVGII